MEKILEALQEFHLDVDAMRAKAEKMQREGNVIEILPPTPGLDLINKLRKKGYTVFFSTKMISGIPKSFVVSTEIGQKGRLKSDFDEAAKSLGIEWFRTGYGYIRSEY